MAKISVPPKQYQQGYTEFYKLRFKLTPDVLIPRPETELLVDEVIAHAKRSNHPEELYSDEGSHSLTILDMGTGCGNIAISLAKNLSLHLRGGNLNLIATDISSKALKVARQNAKLHGVLDNITFIQSDLLDVIARSKAIEQSIKKTGIDVIVTNLPYIPSERIPYLDSSVKDFEPHIALDGGKDGFELYRKLFKQIKEKGWKPELIVCEIDYTHGELAVNEALKFFPNAEVEVKTDLAHKQRILMIHFT